MALQDKLDALKADGEPKMPHEVVEAFHRGKRELIDSRLADHALKVGDPAPTFALPDSDGSRISSPDLLNHGPLVVTFYRGAWCPYCNLDLQAIEAEAATIRGLGASLVAISPQTRGSHRENELSFPILSDAGNNVAREFGLVFELPDYLRHTYIGIGTDLAQINGERSWTLPMPARYLIRQNGAIAHAEVYPDYTQRLEPSEIVSALESLASATATR